MSHLPSNFSTFSSIRDVFRSGKPYEEPILVENETVKEALTTLNTPATKDLYNVVKTYHQNVAKVLVNFGTRHNPFYTPIQSGIFLSPNLFLTSAHFLKDAHIETNECFAELSDIGSRFHLNCVVVDPLNDFALFYLNHHVACHIQNMQLSYPSFAGNKEASSGYHVMIHHANGGEKLVSVAQMEDLECESDEFTSALPGGNGACGAPIFDNEGSLVAIHTKREKEFANIRSACLIDKVLSNPAVAIDQRGQLVLRNVSEEILDTLTKIALMAISQIPACHPTQIQEAIKGTFQRNNKTYIYSENRVGGSKDGPRELDCYIEGQQGHHRFYRIEPNPHTYAAYNKDQPKLYKVAAKAFSLLPANLGDWPNSFDFKCYGKDFTATL